MDVAVEFDDVSCRFRSKRGETHALDHVSLRAARGEFLTVLGPSGCGKSTLLKIIAGLVRPTEGSVRLLGQPVTRPQTTVGYVFQQPALLEWRNVRRNILIQAEMRRMERREAERRADELMEMVGLRDFERALPHELSGGMQQRVSLCRALLHKPPVLLMDEPFGALDALTREHMNVELHRIWRETGTTVMLVTHSIAEALYLGQRVVVFSPRPGRILDEIALGLPTERDYARTLADDRFRRATAHARALLSDSLEGRDTRTSIGS